MEQKGRAEKAFKLSEPRKYVPTEYLLHRREEGLSFPYVLNVLNKKIGKS